MKLPRILAGTLVKPFKLAHYIRLERFSVSDEGDCPLLEIVLICLNELLAIRWLFVNVSVPSLSTDGIHVANCSENFLPFILVL